MYNSGIDTQHTPVWKQGPNTLQLGLGCVSGLWNAITRLPHSSGRRLLCLSDLCGRLSCDPWTRSCIRPLVATSTTCALHREDTYDLDIPESTGG